MKMSTWAIRKPVPSLALFLVLFLVGLVRFSRLPVTQFPNIDIPIITVSIGLTGVRHVLATATNSAANLIIEFELETDTDRALNDIKDAVVMTCPPKLPSL